MFPEEQGSVLAFKKGSEEQATCSRPGSLNGILRGVLEKVLLLKKSFTGSWSIIVISAFRLLFCVNFFGTFWQECTTKT